ncbi:hypothetical protein Syun_023532 [Stephania yunnanensis]|uniref:Uncharacterized protein n=1 Tax=Stephania yunnanensis TaxID=152371 RepID=A0AAP0I3D5_9MAGN
MWEPRELEFRVGLSGLGSRLSTSYVISRVKHLKLSWHLAKDYEGDKVSSVVVAYLDSLKGIVGSDSRNPHYLKSRVGAVGGGLGSLCRLRVVIWSNDRSLDKITYSPIYFASLPLDFHYFT